MTWLITYLLVSASVTLLAYAIITDEVDDPPPSEMFTAFMIGIAWPVTVLASLTTYLLLKGRK